MGPTNNPSNNFHPTSKIGIPTINFAGIIKRASMPKTTRKITSSTKKVPFGKIKIGAEVVVVTDPDDFATAVRIAKG